MKYITYILNFILIFSLVGSLIFLVFAMVQRFPSWHEVIAELILVIVLAAEGLFAIFHISESRAERQAESLRDFIHDYASPDAIEEREKLFTELPWGHDFGFIPQGKIQWICEKSGNTVVYKMKENNNCVIEVTMESKAWRRIQQLSDQFHFAGLSCKRGYIAVEDALNWIGPQPLRWRRRLGHIIEQERIRRKNPRLFYGFEELAKSAQDFFHNI